MSRIPGMPPMSLTSFCESPEEIAKLDQYQANAGEVVRKSRAYVVMALDADGGLTWTAGGHCEVRDMLALLWGAAVRAASEYSELRNQAGT